MLTTTQISAEKTRFKEAVVTAMRKGRKTKIGYVSTHLSASEIYLALNGVALESGNPVLIFNK